MTRSKLYLAGLFALSLCGAAQGAGTSSCGGTVGSENLLLVDKSEARCSWPFKATTIAIACKKNAYKGGDAVYLLARGASFPLNGNAKDAGPLKVLRGGDIKEISDSSAGAAEWIRPGLDLCQRGGTKLD